MHTFTADNEDTQIEQMISRIAQDVEDTKIESNLLRIEYSNGEATLIAARPLPFPVLSNSGGSRGLGINELGSLELSEYSRL